MKLEICNIWHENILLNNYVNQSMISIPNLEFLLQIQGLEGAIQYLQEHRRHRIELKNALLQPVTFPLAEVISNHKVQCTESYTGLTIEKLSIPAQRVFWTALLSSKKLLPSEDCLQLASTYVKLTGCRPVTCCDSVSLHLCKLIIKRSQSNTVSMDQTLLQQKLKHFLVPQSLLPNVTKPRADLQYTSINKRQKVKNTHIETKRPPSSVNSTNDTENNSYEIKHKTITHSTSTKPALKVNQLPNQEISHIDEIKSSSEPNTYQQVSLPTDIKDLAISIGIQLSQVVYESNEASLSMTLNQGAIEPLANQVVSILCNISNNTDINIKTKEMWFEECCEICKFSSATDNAMQIITRRVLDQPETWNSTYVDIFIKVAIRPKILSATAVISRSLLQTVQLFKEKYMTSLVNSLLLPVLQTSNISSAQGEAITRILQQGVPVDLIENLLSSSCMGIHGPMLINDSYVLIVQGILNKGVQLSNITCEKLIESSSLAIEVAPNHVMQSIKFATLIFTIISKYSNKCLGQLDELESIAKQLKTSLGKTALRSIQHLRSQSSKQ